jgi:hypothetical protein
MLDAVGGAPSAPAAGGDGAPGDEVYKVLVLDRACRDVVSPLVRVADLRKHGVTLHLLLESERQPIPEVPALYFVTPSEGVVRRIGRDLGAKLYEAAHLHFASPLPRPALEALAAEAVRAEAMGAVARVVEQHLAFVSLEPRCFSLGLPRAFVQLNDPAAAEKDIQARCRRCPRLSVARGARLARVCAANAATLARYARAKRHTPAQKTLALCVRPSLRDVLALTPPPTHHPRRLWWLTS